MKSSKDGAVAAVTAECELVFSIYVFWYLAHNGIASPEQYLLGFLLMVAGFVSMQRALIFSSGMRYRDMPKMIRKNLQRIRVEKNV